LRGVTALCSLIESLGVGAAGWQTLRSAVAIPAAQQSNGADDPLVTPYC